MDFVRSPLSYGKVDEQAEKAFRQKTVKRLIVIGVSSIILSAVIICAVVGVVVHKRSGGSKSTSTQSATGTTLDEICNITRYPNSCHSSLSSIILGTDNASTSDPKLLFRLSLIVAINEHSKISGYPSKLVSETNDERIKAALRACEELFDDALEYLNETTEYFDEIVRGGKGLTLPMIDDMRTKLSTVIADQDSCLEGFEEIRDLNPTVYDKNPKLVEELRGSMQNATEFVSNSLAIITRILVLVAKIDDTFHHRRLLVSQETKGLGFPTWQGPSYRRLLLGENPNPNTTVAKDGTGNFKTISEAVAAVPEKSNSRFVIYVKEGVYVENVAVVKSKWNVMIYGDGNTKTIVSGSLNKVDHPNLSTFKTATFDAEGKGFIAKDIGFINTAGPEKHQAVAFRSKSDCSAMYRCAFYGYQDTLYAHANRQFYRECHIVGTIDFICGHAAAVFQKCAILPRQPLPNQYDTITAQAKSDPNEISGFSIHRCTISPFNGQSFVASTYLGRPWKSFSTTVVMQSYIESLVDPSGWIAWGVPVWPPRTLSYGEYKNFGPGSGLQNRVKWVGYNPNMTDNEAHKFTVGGFIRGDEWLPVTGVPFDESL